MMNHRFLPEIAKKYGCGLADVRTPWLQYLRDNHYEPKQLLKDGVRLTAQGNYLMARLVGRYLVHRPDLPDAGWKDLTRTDAVKAGDWKDGKLTIEFEGNRADVLPDE